MGHGASSKNRQKTESEVAATDADADLPMGKSYSEPARPRSSSSTHGSHRHRHHIRGKRLTVQVPKPGDDRRRIQLTSSFDRTYQLGPEVMPSTNAGTYVHHATRLSDSKDVVIKLRRKAQSFRSGSDSEKAWRESTEYLLNLPRHEHITQIYEALEDGENYYVVMEKVDGLDLFEVLGSDERPSRLAIRSILHQLLAAVAALHEKGWIHRDLKLENVMVDSPDAFTSESEDSPVRPVAMTRQPSVKIIDFDTVEEFSPKRDAKVVLGTDMYIAQEAYAGHYSPASDIFAVGVIAYKMLTGKFPFPDSVFHGGAGENYVGSPAMKQTQEEIKEFVIDWARHPFDIDEAAQELCRWMLSHNDIDRPTAKQALDHRWFSIDLDGEADLPSG